MWLGKMSLYLTKGSPFRMAGLRDGMGSGGAKVCSLFRGDVGKKFLQTLMYLTCDGKIFN